VYCAHCGTKNVDGLESCERCGELLERINSTRVAQLGMKSCPDCQAVNDPRGSYCIDCGRNLDTVITTSGTRPRSMPPRPAAPIGVRGSPASPTPPAANGPGSASKPAGPRTQGSSAEIRRPTPEPARPSVSPGEVRTGRGPDDLRIDAEAPAIAPNDSGTPDAQLPEELKGWNLGGLFIPFVWGPFNRVWIGLAVLSVGLLPVPPLLGLIVYGPIAIFVSMRGNELAWRARKWDSVDHFRSVQGQWAKWGGISFIIFIVTILISVSSGGA
jgi:hypothetical protein